MKKRILFLFILLIFALPFVYSFTSLEGGGSGSGTADGNITLDQFDRRLDSSQQIGHDLVGQTQSPVDYDFVEHVKFNNISLWNEKLLTTNKVNGRSLITALSGSRTWDAGDHYILEVGEGITKSNAGGFYASIYDYTTIDYEATQSAFIGNFNLFASDNTLTTTTDDVKLPSPAFLYNAIISYCNGVTGCSQGSNIALYNIPTIRVRVAGSNMNVTDVTGLYHQPTFRSQGSGTQLEVNKNTAVYVPDATHLSGSSRVIRYNAGLWYKNQTKGDFTAGVISEQSDHAGENYNIYANGTAPNLFNGTIIMRSNFTMNTNGTKVTCGMTTEGGLFSCFR